MSSVVRNQISDQPVQKFNTSELTPYDGYCWEPSSFTDDVWEQDDFLDIDELIDIGKKTMEVLDEYGIVNTPIKNHTVLGEEVGDDRVDLSRDPRRLATGLIVQELVIHMKTSKFDTFISKELWNFCEITNSVPSAVEQSFNYCRKTNGFENLGFVDVPPLRILLDVSKGDMSHSSTTPGKAAMLGNRMRTPRTELLQGWYLASYLQDGFLRTSRSTEPKYLPQIMGGSGVRAPFGDKVNLYLSVHAYRGGEYQRVYGTATRELLDCLNHLERGKATMPVLCRRLRDKQEYLHGTYDHQVFIPSHSFIDRETGKLPPPLIRASGGSNWFVSYENRLIRTKNLITRTSAEREWAFTSRIRDQLLSAITTPTTDRLIALNKLRGRAKFGFALSANSAFSNLLNRNATIKDVKALTNENFITVNTGVTHFTLIDAEWLFYGGKTECFTIEDLTSSEDLFLRAEVSEEETFKVGGIPLRPIRNDKIRNVVTTTKVGLYEIGPSMEEWARNLTDRLLTHRSEGKLTITRDDARSEYIKDPEWVNDDSSIIGRCLIEHGPIHLRSTRVILVSDDKRLGNQLANTCNVAVIRVAPADYILWCRKGNRDIKDQFLDPETLSQVINHRGRNDPVRAIYCDTGSISAAASRLQEEILVTPGILHQRNMIETGTDINGFRFERYTLTSLGEGNHLRSMYHTPVAKPKRFRHKSADPSSYYSSRRDSTSNASSGSDSLSWRSSFSAR